MELERIIAKAMEKDRAARYQSASEMRADLQRLRRDTMVGRATAAAGVAAVVSVRSRRRWWVGAAAAAVVLVLAAGLWLSREAKRAGPTVTPAETPSIAVLPFVNMSGEQENE